MVTQDDKTLQVDAMHFTARGEEAIAGLFCDYIAEHGLLDASVARAGGESVTAGTSR